MFLKNNIIHSGPFSTSYYTNYGTGSAVLDRNLYFGLNRGDVPQEDANPVGGRTDSRNPHFAAPALGDFQLKRRSPAIDQAVDLPFPVIDDYQQTARPNGSRADVGAYEYIAR